jgi:hypothetical protein
MEITKESMIYFTFFCHPRERGGPALKH